MSKVLGVLLDWRQAGSRHASDPGWRCFDHTEKVYCLVPNV